MLNCYQDIQQLKRRGKRHKKVASDNCMRVVPEKRRPALIAARATRWPYRHVFTDSSWRNPKSQFEKQFVGDALLTPGGILDRHSPNKFAQFEPNGWTSRP